MDEASADHPQADAGRPDGLLLLERARAGDPRAICSLLDAMDRWARDALQDGRRRPLETYLRLPRSPAALKRYMRDIWLACAIETIEADGEWSACVRLANEWDKFISRGGWQQSRDCAEPPFSSRLRNALWHATRYNDGQAVGERQLAKLPAVRTALAKKVRATSIMLASSATEQRGEDDEHHDRRLGRDRGARVELEPEGTR
jgi:hypothetical protein